MRRLYTEEDLQGELDKLGFHGDAQEEFLTLYREELARHARNAARRKGILDDAFELGPPSDWQHDGTEVRGHITPGYECLVCHDSRWVKPKDIYGDWGSRKPIPCRCVTENATVRAQVMAERLEDSGLPSELRPQTLEKFKRRKGTSDAYNAALAFLDGLAKGVQPPPWLVLYGPTGAGKSHLLSAVTQRVVTTQRALWAEVPEFLKRCRMRGLVGEEMRDFAYDDALTENAIKTPVLVLDEFGSAGHGNWAREKLEGIINARIIGKRATAFAMTALPDELQAWAPRIFSRLSSPHVRSVVMTATDYRAERQQS